MKKFLAILCAAAMVAGLATSAFAMEGSASPSDPINLYDGDYSRDGGAGAGGAGTTGGGAAVAPAAPAATAETAAPAAPAAATTETAAPAAPAAAVVADIADYTEDSLAKILVSMLNSPAENNQVYTSADVIKAMKIDGQDEKTVAGTAVDTSKLTVISKALDEKSTGAKFTKNADGSSDVELNGNELTKDRKAEELIIIVAPKAPISEAPKALMADVTIENNVLKFQIPQDAAICITLIKE